MQPKGLKIELVTGSVALSDHLPRCHVVEPWWRRASELRGRGKLMEDNWHAVPSLITGGRQWVCVDDELGEDRQYSMRIFG